MVLVDLADPQEAVFMTQGFHWTRADKYRLGECDTACPRLKRTKSSPRSVASLFARNTL